MPVALNLRDHSIWTCCFAKGLLPRDFIQGSPIASNAGTREIPMLISVILPAAPGARPILVDTGFAGGKSMTGRRFADYEAPESVLAKLGFAPDDVETILLTHLHFDHAGCLDRFPRAQILLQRSEYEGWRGALDARPDIAAGKQSWILSSLNLDDIARFEAAMKEGRVRLLDGDVEVFPGITLHLAAESHTFGCQWVEVETADGPFALAGDCAVSYANIERMWPPGYHQGNAWNLLRCYETLVALVGPDRLHRIVPGHDMELFRRNLSRVIGRNPVSEIHLAAGTPSRLPEGSPIA